MTRHPVETSTGLVPNLSQGDSQVSALKKAWAD